jgi:ligand-binding sensor domain-containing protein/signal transduction histidine kinase
MARALRKERGEDVSRRYGACRLPICALAAIVCLGMGKAAWPSSPSAESPSTLRTATRPTTASLQESGREELSPDEPMRTTGGAAQAGQTETPDQAEFEHISVEHGLSHSSVNCILQDQQGFMWFGTDNGLNRYDGYDLLVFQTDPDGDRGLSHETVTSLVEDQTGGLWIGTRGGLDRLDLETGRFSHYRHDENNPHSLISDQILVLYQDSAHRLWVGTSGGLDRLDQDAQGFVHYRADADGPDHLPDNRVLSAYEDSSGILWIGTWGGLASWSPERNGFIHHQLAAPDATGLRHNAVHAIVEDSDGELWIGTGGNGFYRFNRQTGRFRRHLVDPEDVRGFAQNRVLAIHQDREGLLWLGTDGGGLYQFDRDGNPLTAYQKDPQDSASLSSNYVNAIYESQHGVLWVGTSGGGVNKLDRDKHAFTLYQADPADPSSLSHNRVLALSADEEGILWVGTDGGGLNRFDRPSGSFTHYTYDPDDLRSLSSNRVSAVHPGRDGKLWIGTWGGGIAELDPKKGRFTRYQADPLDAHTLNSNTVHAIHQDREGMLWVGTDAGLDRFDPTVGRFIGFLALDVEVRAIHESPQGDIWFGTDDGLGRFDREHGRVTKYRTASGYASTQSRNDVNAIHQDGMGMLWIGTQGGLSQFDPDTEVFTHYGEKDGLAHDAVRAILEDDQGHLWISTAGGLSRFDPSTGVFRNYDVSDGLQGYEFTRARCRSRDGMIFFGGINGFNALDPNSIRGNPHPPPVFLTALAKGGREVSNGSRIGSVEHVRLTWPDNALEFSFVALNYHQSEKNLYAYRLEGFDREWNAAGTRRFGRYTNLPGGTYNLSIKASNNDGIWNELGTSVKVTVVPPFWAAGWFRGSVLLLVIAGAWAAYRLRVRGIEARSLQLEKVVADRTAALSRANELLKQEIAERKRAEKALAQRAAEAAVAAERSRLARELHDAVTQLLFSARLIAEALPAIWESDREEGMKLLLEIQRLSGGALAEMRTLLLELRPAALTETSLVDLLHQLAEAATGRADLPISITTDKEPALPDEVHIALYRIAQEALNNIVKHARASQATISLVSASHGHAGGAQQQVTLSVRDDGCGFDPEHVPPDHLGLVIIRERAARVGADLRIESDVGRGTEVMVRWRGACP